MKSAKSPAGAMIEAVSTVTTAEPKRAAKAPESDEALPFSYALAAASLEQRAGASLKAHGGAQSDAAETARAEPRAESTDASPRANTTDTPQRAAARDDAATAHEPAEMTKPLSPPHPGESRAPAAAQNLVPASAGMSGALTAVTTASPQNTAKPLPVVEGFARDAARAATEARKPAPAEAPRQAQPAQDFARLLAKRLDDGETSFHLRLDPPELGRVEAKLIMGDDGKAALALGFDNQSALDLFSRDEAQLRAALLASGFDAGGANISFSLNDRGAASREQVAASSARLPIASDHSFLAPVSSGVVDISA